MEFKSESSKVKLEETSLIAENQDFAKKEKTMKYNTIKYSDIKELTIVSYVFVQYIFYVFGLMFISYGFSKKEHKILDRYYSNVPATLEEKIIYSIIGILIIAFGLYFHFKFRKSKSLVAKHFEGKIKKTTIFTSENHDDVTKLKEELEKHITK